MAELSPVRRARLTLGRALLGLGLTAAVAAAGWRASRPLPVVATPISRGHAVSAVYATGTVEAATRAQIKAKVTGTLQALRVREGQHVKQGDLIATIDSPTLDIDLRRGRSDLAAARAQSGRSAPQIEALRGQEQSLQAERQLAEREVTRLRTLVDSGSLPSSDLERAEAQLAALEGNLRTNRAQQRSLQIDLGAVERRRSAEVQALDSRASDAELRAPIDGVLLSRLVEPGELVSAGQALFTIGDTRELQLEVSVDEADIAKVSDGTQGRPASRAAVSLYAFPGEAFEGHVTEVLPDANRIRKSFLTKVRLTAPPAGLRSGMSAELNLIVEQREGVLLAPSSALSGTRVWVVREGRAQPQEVTTGLRDLLRVELISGVTEGELVVVEGAATLKAGARVSVTERPLPALEPVPDAARAAR